jgi:hypothetical protein
LVLEIFVFKDEDICRDCRNVMWLRYAAVSYELKCRVFDFGKEFNKYKTNNNKTLGKEKRERKKVKQSRQRRLTDRKGVKKMINVRQVQQWRVRKRKTSSHKKDVQLGRRKR